MPLLAKFKNRIRILTQSKDERRHALVGPAWLWKKKRDFQIKFLSDMGLKSENYLFEIGCGTLRGGVPLIEYLDNTHYYGVEVREEVLGEARKELRDAGLEEKNPNLLFAPDISLLIVSKEFDFIWAFSVLIHMNDEILNDTLGFVSKHLLEDGVFYANVNIDYREEGIWQGFPVVARSFDFYSQICLENSLVATDIGPLKKFGHIVNVESQDNQRMLKIVRRV